MHEAGGKDAPAMLAFFTRMSTLVRDTDRNHLIILGTNNGDTPATSTDGNPSPFATLQALDTVDLVDTQDFGSPDTPVSASEQTDVNIAQSQGKPCFVGASAVSISDTSAAAFSQRASRVSAKIDGVLNAGFVGFLSYAYTPGWQIAWVRLRRAERRAAGGPERCLGKLCGPRPRALAKCADCGPRAPGTGARAGFRRGAYELEDQNCMKKSQDSLAIQFTLEPGSRLLSV